MVNERFHRLVDSRAWRRRHFFVLNSVVASGHAIENLANDAHRLANFGKTNGITIESVAIATDNDVKLQFGILHVRHVAAQVPRHAGAAQDWSGGAKRYCLVARDYANTLQALAPDGLIGHQDVVLAQTIGQHVKNFEHVIAPARWHVGGYSTRANEVVVHAQAGHFLEEAQHDLSLAPSVQHHRHGANVHSVGCHKQQVAAHAVEFGHEHANPHGPLGYFAVDSQQFFGGHGKNKFAVQWRQIIHARDVGATLHERERLARFFHSGMQVANDWLATQHCLALQFQHQTQHAVGAWVLRAHVDDHCLVFARVGSNVCQQRSVGLAHAQHRANFAQHFLRGQFATRTKFLVAFKCSGCCNGHDAAPLNCTGMRPCE